MSKSIDTNNNPWYTPWLRKNTRPTINKISVTNTQKVQNKTALKIQNTYPILPKIIPKRRESILYIPENTWNPEIKKRKQRKNTKTQIQIQTKTKAVEITSTKKISFPNRNVSNKNIHLFQRNIYISPYLKNYKIPKLNHNEQRQTLEHRQSILHIPEYENDFSVQNSAKPFELNHTIKTEFTYFRNHSKTKNYLKNYNQRLKQKKATRIKSQKIQVLYKEFYKDVSKLLRKYNKYADPDYKKEATQNSRNNQNGKRNKAEDGDSINSDKSISFYLTQLKEIHDDV